MAVLAVAWPLHVPIVIAAVIPTVLVRLWIQVPHVYRLCAPGIPNPANGDAHTRHISLGHPVPILGMHTHATLP